MLLILENSIVMERCKAVINLQSMLQNQVMEESGVQDGLDFPGCTKQCSAANPSRAWEADHPQVPRRPRKPYQGNSADHAERTYRRAFELPWLQD